jgi:hypothetical protein
MRKHDLTAIGAELAGVRAELARLRAEVVALASLLHAAQSRPPASAPGPGVDDLTPCARDLLAILSTATRRLTGDMLLREMDRRGQIYGARTAQRALADLVRRGIIEAHRRAPRGYCLPGKPMPLPAELL